MVHYRRFIPPNQPLLRMFLAVEQPVVGGPIYYAMHVSSVIERENIVATHGIAGYRQFLRGVRRDLARSVAQRVLSVRSAEEPINYRDFIDQPMTFEERSATVARLIGEGAQ